MDRINVFAQMLEQMSVEFLLNEPMSRHTTFHIGGCCDIMLWPDSMDAVKKCVLACKQKDIPYFILGKGSNLLVSDAGCRYVVISTSKMNKIEMIDGQTIYCQSGASLMNLCKFAQRHSLSGLEFAYGIPGSVGGAVYMNAGAYGGEICDVVTKSEHICSDGEFRSFCAQQLDFSYRHSAYHNFDCCIVGVVFRLSKGDSQQIQMRMDELMQRRKSKQPLNYYSAGSTFQRPKGGYASALIEQSGLKGFSVGGAMVSEKHSGFVVNTGSASCADVEAVIEQVQKIVKQKTGIALYPEIKILR